MTGSSSGGKAAAGNASTNPYIAFRRRTEKMQTRKNRKNDETSYEKMLKLRRDLSRAIVLLVSVLFPMDIGNSCTFLSLVCQTLFTYAFTVIKFR